MDFKTFALVLASLATIPATDIYLPSLPGMAEHFKVAASAIDDTIVAYQMGSLIAALVLGFFSDRFGRKPLILFGLSLFFVGSLFCTFTEVFSVFIFGRVLEGAGAVSIPVVGWAMIHDLYTKEEGAKIMSILGATFSTLPLISPTLGGYIDMTLGWHWNFGILSILSGFTILLLFFKLEDVQVPKKNIPSLSFQSYIKSCSAVFKNTTFLSYVLIFSVLLCGEWCYLTLIPFYLEKTLEFGAKDCGLFISLVGISYIVGAAITPKLISSFGVEKTIGFGVIFSCIGAISLLVATIIISNVYIISAFSIASFLFGIAVVWAPSTTKSLETFKTNKGTASSIRSIIFTSSSALGSFLAGLMFPLNLYSLAQFLCVCAFLTFLIFRIQLSREKLLT